mmetsp:Transcript_724/g.2981  ORF Transcript_724/g.2981 Transcript_724/m.2981 type:complete len:258 (-) Transcript_724:272-1045(-)
MTPMCPQGGRELERQPEPLLERPDRGRRHHGHAPSFLQLHDPAVHWHATPGPADVSCFRRGDRSGSSQSGGEHTLDRPLPAAKHPPERDSIEADLLLLLTPMTTPIPVCPLGGREPVQPEPLLERPDRGRRYHRRTLSFLPLHDPAVHWHATPGRPHPPRRVELDGTDRPRHCRSRRRRWHQGLKQAASRFRPRDGAAPKIGRHARCGERLGAMEGDHILDLLPPLLSWHLLPRAGCRDLTSGGLAWGAESRFLDPS